MLGKLAVISGSSGVGKGTVIRGFLEKHPDFKLSVSCTTRSPRIGEIDGVNYFFLTSEQFDKSVENGEFLEYASFSGNLYGTKHAYVEKKLSQGENLILEIDTQGALQVKAKMKDAILIFILPPSIDELENRLRGRNTESEDAIRTRLNFVKSELKNSEKFDKKIVNDTIENAVKQLEEVLC